jgi:opacity protein-like surface antigen
MKKTILAASLLILLASAAAQSHQQDGFQMEVLVNGSTAPKYFQSGKFYIEALKNQEYSIRLTNPLNRRVAVALAVDGLNSIDARTSDAFSAKKWVLGPYETITIDGWQVNQQQARKFFFTTEAKSYGQWLGKTQNLGIISAVFYRERLRWNQHPGGISSLPREESSDGRSSNREARQEAPQTSAGAASDSATPAPRSQQKTDDYAATGIGGRTEHAVQWVNMELESTPAATINLRYEFRPVLVSMGILPAPPAQDILSRREQARGFANYCPEPR